MFYFDTFVYSREGFKSARDFSYTGSRSRVQAQPDSVHTNNI